MNEIALPQFNLTGRATSSNWVPFTGDAAFDRAEYCYTPGRDYEGLVGRMWCVL